MLDVLELDAARSPDEERVRVRRIDDVRDVQLPALRLFDVLAGRLHEEAEMVEERPVGLSWIAGLEVDVCVAGPKPAPLDDETERRQLREDSLRIAHAKGDVIDVVWLAGRFDRDKGHAVRGAREFLVCSAGGNPDRDVCQHAPITGAVGGEERQLAPSGVRPHEGEGVRPLDHVHPKALDEEVGKGVTVFDPQRDVVEGFDVHTTTSTHPQCFERGLGGENSTVQRKSRRVLVLAARQPALVSELEEAGFAVEPRTRPLADGERVATDLAIIFRGRLIGRNQALLLAKRGVPVIEVHTAEPQTPSTAGWIRLSNRIPKSDLVQLARAVADGSENGRSAA